MKRMESNDINRAYAMWDIAGTSLIVAAVAGSAIFAVFTGTADAGTLAWGIIGIASLLEALVLFGYGLRLRQRYVNKVQTYETKREGTTGPTTAPTGQGFPSWATARPTRGPHSTASDA
jgi:membrane protein implicated in regulation of membrane protease activity